MFRLDKDRKAASPEPIVGLSGISIPTPEKPDFPKNTSRKLSRTLPLTPISPSDTLSKSSPVPLRIDPSLSPQLSRSGPLPLRTPSKSPATDNKSPTSPESLSIKRLELESAPNPAPVSPVAKIQTSPRGTSPLAPPAASNPPQAQKVAPNDSSSQNGTIYIRYNHYKKEATIEKGELNAAIIDDLLSLSFVFPSSRLFLSEDDGTGHPKATGPLDAKNLLPIRLVDKTSPTNNSNTMITGLTVGTSYWVIILEDETEKALAEKRQEEYYAKKRQERENSENSTNDGIRAEKLENCSCIEGNPCAEPYNCKDWNNRFAVAKAHGWKGHS